MGRHAAVNHEQVAAAAEQLQSDGLTPTARLVRTKLGNVGSLATIQKHLTEWRSREGSGQSAARMLPPEVQRAVFKFLDEEVSRINGELRQQVEQAERDTADIADDNEALTTLVSQLREELGNQAALKDKQEGQLGRLLEELRGAREEAVRERGEAELARHELTRIQSRLEAQVPVEHELQQLRVGIEAERERRVRAELEAAVLMAQKDNLEARIVELKDAAASRDRPRASGNSEHGGNQPERTLQAGPRPHRKVESLGESSASNAEPPINSATAGEQSDPRQAQLC
ncbi:DNA-binding protein [Massilia norwichensis]|uniref:DNA-binding protein n=1 Tax=Massilia norwichensis TaxID=1442366 RepID=A0ABT2AER8_9BURK|nr:DNA-binding protein [Massilia norwichensis]MCS0592527.1 DNA-binding protein [Massilia norwichensis]